MVILCHVEGDEAATNKTKTNMKLSTLVKLALHIESVLGVTARGSINEVKARLQSAAADCRTKRQAVAAIASKVYGHDCNGDYPATDSALLGEF